MKLTGADRISRAGFPFVDVVPFARALLEAASGRMVWSTDWPQSGYFDAARMPDDSALADLCAKFAPDAALRQRLLVDNPTQLFASRRSKIGDMQNMHRANVTSVIDTGTRNLLGFGVPSNCTRAMRAAATNAFATCASASLHHSNEALAIFNSRNKLRDTLEEDQ